MLFLAVGRSGIGRVPLSAGGGEPDVGRGDLVQSAARAGGAAGAPVPPRPEAASSLSPGLRGHGSGVGGIGGAIPPDPPPPIIVHENSWDDVKS